MRFVQLPIFELILFHSTNNNVLAYPWFAERIPNGYSVPNPGPQGGIWAGVGHVNAGGGGERNAFGEDFASQGFEWTDTLCQMDSDGDGRSNGIELGDPTCEWYEGGPNPNEPALSHPGISDEPVIAASSNSCADYLEPEESIMLDVSFTQPSTMDQTQTHYICEQKYVDVSSIDLVHMVKTSVLLDNQDVLHHMFIHYCPEGASDGDRVGEGQYSCSGNEARCRRIAGWAIGPHESCQPNNVGAELDFTGLDQILIKIEAHYDNVSGQFQQDQSGMQLTMTPNLRPLKAGSSILGMATIDRNFEIPPQQTSYSLTNICPGEATQMLSHPIFVYQFTPHMHLFGRGLYTEHYRCGKKIGEIGRIDSYEFDNQQNYRLTRPVKVLPGDALVTVCTYNSQSSETTIEGGEETTNEMCLNFLSFYPNVETDDHPSLLAACFSFENGIQSEDRDLELRFATVGDATGGTSSVIIDFESDPTQAVAPCCAIDSCDEMYRAEIGGACAVETDCNDGLVCAGGLCKMLDSVVDVSEPTATLSPPNSSPAGEIAMPVATPSTDLEVTIPSSIPTASSPVSVVSTDQPSLPTSSAAPNVELFSLFLVFASSLFISVNFYH